jgi:glutamate-1-semialdehyde 2,1-aminomutase/spore coat polysaccharide biosynthesis protein SpsF
MKTVAILQARVASTRLPGKVLADIAGHPMLWHVVNRVRHAKLVNQLVVATSDKPSDDPIADFCNREGIACFRGNEDDVLDRFYQGAREFKADTVVRITADCPLIDPTIIDKVIQQYQTGNYDYVTNTLRYTYPDGLDVEVFSFNALVQAWNEATTRTQREHVTPYIRTSGRFRIAGVENEEDLFQQGHRWTVDEPRDLDFVRKVYKHLYDENKVFLMQDILRLLGVQPELRLINRNKIRNEGYYLSIAREHSVMEPTQRKLDQTKAYLERARRLIPSQTQTFSKGPTQFVQGVSPVFLQRGKGSHVWDVDGNEYIDYITALGPVILGYNYSAVTEVVIKQIQDGTTFSLPHYLEVELAELLTEIIPCAEMVRYGKNGSDATSGAVRVARAFTGREKIACCGYHGWQDWYIGTTTRRLGVPKSTQELTLTFEYNKIESLEQLFADSPGEIAAVIMEPIGVIEPENDFLAKVKELAHENGALLIFDEIVTGFRVALGGAQEFFRVIPDLACFGKAMANGFPLSAVVGRREIMKLFNEVFFSFTFGGEAVSLAAAIATIKEMKEKNVIGHLWEQGQKLKDGYNVLAREFGLAECTQCLGLPPHTVMIFNDKNGADGLVVRSLLQQELVKRGVLFLVGGNICYSHSNADVDYTLHAFRAALKYMAKALDSDNPLAFLKGDPVQPIFRRA